MFEEQNGKDNWVTRLRSTKNTLAKNKFGNAQIKRHTHGGKRPTHLRPFESLTQEHYDVSLMFSKWFGIDKDLFVLYMYLIEM